MKGIAGLVRRALLENGPATVRELALELGVPRRDAQLGVWILTSSDHAICVGLSPNLEAGVRGQRRTFKLYDLTPRGRAFAKLKKQGYFDAKNSIGLL